MKTNGIPVWYDIKSVYDLRKNTNPNHKVKDNRCHYCKCRMIFSTQDNYHKRLRKAATLDHVYFKWDMRRVLCRRTVPCCWNCNHTKNETDTEWFKQGYEKEVWKKASKYLLTELIKYPMNIYDILEEVNDGTTYFNPPIKVQPTREFTLTSIGCLVKLKGKLFIGRSRYLDHELTDDVTYSRYVIKAIHDRLTHEKKLKFI